MQTRFMAAALSGALILPVQVFAGSSPLPITEARVTLSDLSYTVQDLRLYDGVAPAMRWDGTWALSASASEAAQAGWAGGAPAWGDTGERAASVAAPEVDLGATSQHGAAESYVWVTGTGMRVLDVDAQVQDGLQASASAGFSQQFTLGAGTQVTFSVLFDTGLQGGAYSGPWTPPDEWGDPVHASASYAAVMSVNRLSSTVGGYADNSFVGDPDSFEAHLQKQVLTLTVSNTGLSDKTYLFGLTGYVQADAALSAVPEPGGTALWLAGLSLMGWCVRRRRGHRAFS